MHIHLWYNVRDSFGDGHYGEVYGGTYSDWHSLLSIMTTLARNGRVWRVQDCASGDTRLVVVI